MTVCFFVCLLTATCFAADRKKQRELAKLEDTWIAHIDQDTSAEMILRDSTLTYTWFHEGGKKQLIWAGSFTIDPTTSPKQMDWLAKNPDQPGAPRNHAIYRLEGDLLLIIGNNRGKRPEKFYAGSASQPTTVVFQRKSSVDPPSKSGGFKCITER